MSQTESGEKSLRTVEALMDHVKGMPVDFASMSLADYIANYWAPALRRRLDPRTAKHYETLIRLYVSNDIMHQPIATIRRGQLRALLRDLLDCGLARATVATVAYRLSSVFGSAFEDEVIIKDPAVQISRALALRNHHPERMKAMNAAQLGKFLRGARQHEPDYFLQLATLAYTGIRIGELRGLQISDVDLAGCGKTADGDHSVLG